MTNRNTTQILVEVLESTNVHVGVTELCQRTNLPYNRLNKLVHNLTSSGLMNQIEVEGKKTFIITENGRTLLEEYNKFTRFAEGFGLEL